jgi:hypothetical protein
VDEGRLTDSDSPDYLVFADNVAFNSPGAGAHVVNAGNLNGRIN